MSKNWKNKEDFETILMMRLFQENVKKDITNTSELLKIVQEKLKDCDLNLSSLKQNTSELNVDFANIQNKVKDLDQSLRTITSTRGASSSSSSSLLWSSRSSSSSSSCGDYSLSLSHNSSICNFSDNESMANDLADKIRDELEELESTYIFVSHSPGTNSEPTELDYKQVKRAMSSSTSTSSSSSSSLSLCKSSSKPLRMKNPRIYPIDSNSEDEDNDQQQAIISSKRKSYQEYKKIDENCVKLIKMLLQSTMATTENNQRS